MRVSLKVGSANIGGTGVPLFFSSQQSAYSLLWHVLNALVSGLVVLMFAEFYLSCLFLIDISTQLKQKAPKLIGKLDVVLSYISDSLRFSSALSIALAVAFLVITLAIAIFKLISGTVVMPRLLPDVTDLTSFLKLFTVFPVLVTAFICHYNGMQLD